MRKRGTAVFLVQSELLLVSIDPHWVLGLKPMRASAMTFTPGCKGTIILRFLSLKQSAKALLVFCLSLYYHTAWHNTMICFDQNMFPFRLTEVSFLFMVACFRIGASRSPQLQPFLL